MRNWSVALALSAVLSAHLWAQQKGTGTEDGAKATADAPEKNAAPANGASVAPATRNLFALPAAPQPAPFPTAAASKDETPVGRLVPRYETAVGYSYVNFFPGDPFDSFNNHGATGSFTYNASKWIGLTGEIGSYHFNQNISGMSTGGNWTTFLFGPRLNLRRFDHFVPFAEFLFGGANGGQELVGGGQNMVGGNGSQTAFAMAAGGGVDVVLMKNLAWRFVQLDYLMTSFSGSALGPSARQNNFRVGTGLVLPSPGPVNTPAS